ncbi:peptidylprolyl isomerase [Qipengyuania sp. DY56-A-20]|jgi:cyclophilin family peptidyl-prolyl cis-trans isomerase|uniref:Peptidyl-prolyl cis-trans isomerase n=1 Tax=Qipengyuania benthica TaxID=3067651 RepID=A0ABT9H7Q2_9SPHN|nr:peptidylprolyl isomerase [Qipengyuania sp. DY56-A-20]MDP4539343.1 peptidylprolyl isomerase [Qipengyuania sp. DY56-A-20]
MLKFSPALAALAAFAVTPLAGFSTAAHAQEAPAEAAPVYAPINYSMEEDRENILLLDLSNGERVAIRLMPSWAPNHIERIKTLTRQGFYDGVIFHRVIDGFMAQTGDPTGTGQGGSSLPDLEAEFNPMPHVRGTLSMARAQGEDSANSQFFVVFYPRFSLDKRYTNLGRVIANMAAVDAINRGEPPADPTRIVQASLASDNRPVPPPQAYQAPPAAEISADDLNAPIAQ